MSQNQSSPENIIFDKLCMEGDLLKIDKFAKIHQEKLDFFGDQSHSAGIVYRLAKESKLDVLHYLFTTPHITGIPNIYTGPENGQPDDALEVLYNNGQIDFIKYLLSGKNIKDNIEPSYTYITTNKSAERCAKICAPLFEVCLQNKDWDLASYIINSPEIKYPVEKHYSLVVETISNLKNKIIFDDEFINNFVFIIKNYLNKQFETLQDLSNPNEIHPIPTEAQTKIVLELIKLELINPELVLKEIEEKSTDPKWTIENQGAINLSKILLNHQIKGELSQNECQPKKLKI